MKKEINKVILEDGISIDTGVTIDTEEGYGSFEEYDVASGGEYYYAEGGIWIEDMRVTDYDGVYELSEGVRAILEEMGLNLDDL